MTTLPPIKISDPESIARAFHEAYERLAPSFGYETRKASAKPWEQVPANNRALMTAVAAEVAPLIAAQVLREAAQRVERRGSLLCDCEGSDSEPTNPDTKARMDHHCDCAAVYAAAEMLRSGAATTHAAQCSCGVVAGWMPVNGRECSPADPDVMAIQSFDAAERAAEVEYGPGRSLTEDAPPTKEIADEA